MTIKDFPQETINAILLFRCLTPENQDALLDLAEELLRSQEACADSTRTEL